MGPGAVLVTRTGLQPYVEELAEGTWIVAPQGPDGSGISVEELDDRSWVLQRPGGRRRSVQRIGGPRLRAHLVLDEGASRQNMHVVHMQLGRYLAGEHVGAVLRDMEINCVLDVGANHGQFGQMIRKTGYTGRIVSFEPLPHLAEHLHVHADPDPDWHVVHCALGDEDTEADMTVVAERGSTSSLLPVSDFGKEWSPRLAGIRRETVPVRRLEDVFDDAVAGIDEPRVYLKLDTQGYDLRVFAGAGDRIKNVVGMQSEIASLPIYDNMPRLPEAISTYEAAGFETTGIFPVSRDKKTPRMVEFDIVMIRAAAMPQPS